MFVRRTPASNVTRLAPLDLLRMFRQRRSKTALLLARAAEAGAHSASRYLIEPLEERRLFTTLNPNDVFTYTDTRGNLMTITLGPDVTAEAIGATANAGGVVTLTDLTGSRNGIPEGPAGGPAQQDLYALYVTDSTLDSTISVLSTTPFAGAPAPLLVTGTTGAFQTITGDAGDGVGYLGARTPAGAPVTTAPVAQTFGQLPNTLNPLISGFYVAPGHNFGTFIFDGVVTGRVSVGGSIQKFYAGWILTGNTAGELTGHISRPDNFFVDGDIRDIFSRDSIGTNTSTDTSAPTYVSSFDLQTTGKVGEVTTRDAFVGKMDVVNDINFQGLQTPYSENESFAGDPTLGKITSTFAQNDTLVNLFGNNTFPQAQVLGSYLSQTPGEGYIVEVTGSLESDLGDNIDYYAVPMLAGQDIAVDLSSNAVGSVHTGIFDPDGRLVNSDFSDSDQTDIFETAVGFHTDRPGVYVIAIANVSDNTFTGQGNPVGTVDYTLKVTGLGELGLGGVSAINNVRDIFDASLDTPEPGLRVERADFGSVLASNASILSTNDNTLAADNGNLRSIVAVNVGTVVSGGRGLAPRLDVPHGSVGLVRATGLPPLVDTLPPIGGNLSIFDGLDANGDSIPIGRDLQLVDGKGTVFGQFIADGAIGVLRAGDMATPTPSTIYADRDNQGEDGVIDLIDVQGDFGTLGSGGPSISTGLGGNVRYIRVGGDLYPDQFFGGGSPQTTRYGNGESATLTDDSGSTITLTPLGEVVDNPDFDPLDPDPLIPQFFGPHITVTTYPIRTGGVVVVNVTSTGGLDVGGTGANAEISRVEIQGVGRRVITQPEEDLLNISTTPTATPTGEDPLPEIPGQVDPDDELVLEGTDVAVPADDNGGDLQLTIHGSTLLDVFDVVVVRTEAGRALPVAGENNFPEPVDTTQLGNATLIQNSTHGEIVSILAESVGFLSSKGNLGVARTDTGTAVEPGAEIVLGNDLPATRTDRQVQPEPIVLASDIFPFQNQKSGIRLIGGSVIAARAGGSVGNFIVQGTIGDIEANSDKGVTPGVFEGVAAPIVTTNFIELDSPILSGRILNVNIGDGVASSLAGGFSRAGIYAVDRIGNVVNQGLGSDIRGDIASQFRIDSIHLNNGAIIDADIYVTSSYSDTLRTGNPGITVPASDDAIRNPIFEIGDVRLQGIGGILGTRFIGADIGKISSEGGFGIISSTAQTGGNGVLGGFSADGYGIRNSGLFGGAVVRVLNAGGDGSSSSILNYTDSVRVSETGAAINPFTQSAPSPVNDLHLALHLTPSQNEAAGVTDTGIIEDVTAVGSRDVGSVSAYSIRSTDPENNPTTIAFANSSGPIVTRGPINGLQLTTGRLTSFVPGNDVFNTNVVFSGPVKTVHIKGNFTQNSTFTATGRNGRIKSMVVDGDLEGNVTSSGKISSITVGGNISGTIGAQNGANRKLAIGNLTFGGIAPGGTLTVRGQLSNLLSRGNLGGAGQHLDVIGTVKNFKVLGDLSAFVTVSDTLKTLDVEDSLFAADVRVGTTLGLLRVVGDVDQNSIVTARSIRSQQIRGQVFGQIVVTG